MKNGNIQWYWWEWTMSEEVSIQFYTQSFIFDQAKKKTLNKFNLHDGPLQKVIPRFVENESKEKE